MAMRTRSFAITALAAAAFALAACGSGDNETDNAAPAAPAAGAAAPPAAEAAATPPANAGPPAVVTLADVAGRWAEDTTFCGTDDEVTITAEAINMAGGACIVTSADGGTGALAINLICPVEGAEPDGGTWNVTATGPAPFTAIDVAMGELTTHLVRCP
jgi:hypothetical protein